MIYFNLACTRRTREGLGPGKRMRDPSRGQHVDSNMCPPEHRTLIPCSNPPTYGGVCVSIYPSIYLSIYLSILTHTHTHTHTHTLQQHQR